eukprot:GHVR01147411.1.p1 GENE.GHVR01147411.1~~GHVR01147411.1.p1  ORF type:complete len:190 (-),score=34.04 GHVR01147411.1:151-720(-)
MCYMPVTDSTYPAIGPALACAPMNSLVCLDNLPTFFAHVPSGERPIFLRHLEAVFNTNVCDKRGLLIVVLGPSTILPELEKFLLMPQRFQKKVECSISDADLHSKLICDRIPDLKEQQTEQLSKKLNNVNLPINTSKWFLANCEKERRDTPPDAEGLAHALDTLAQMVVDERKVIDLAVSGGHRERMYS